MLHEPKLLLLRLLLLRLLPLLPEYLCLFSSSLLLSLLFLSFLLKTLHGLKFLPLLLLPLLPLLLLVQQQLCLPFPAEHFFSQLKLLQISLMPLLKHCSLGLLWPLLYSRGRLGLG